MKGLPNLERLQLQNCSLSSEALDFLVNSLAETGRRMKGLYIGWNRISREEAEKLRKKASRFADVVSV